MTKSIVHCAVYTRKSSEEGLEQGFNSLHAQREACEAYILSQKQEGWKCLSSPFDDGGISGATMDRPGLQRLLSDIRGKKIDVVVVYKVDRLTRSLADFAKMVEIFDQAGVSFVSITQQFNTTTSMGRLTLNVLLSFAQFEREVTGERIRDKIAASKKKGMWMGGFVPLGYTAKDRTLVTNESEAETVRTLFKLYLSHGSVRELQEIALQKGLRTRLGSPLARGHLYTLLRNPIYCGEIRHKDQRYPGLHTAIIDPGTWAAVQRKLTVNCNNHKTRKYTKEPSLLASRLFDDRGQAFAMDHAVKQGRRYRYYVERDPLDGPSDLKRRRRKRIPAVEIEKLVIAAVMRLLRTSHEVMEAVGESPAGASQTVLKAGTDLADGTVNHYALVQSVVHSVRVSDGAVQIDVDRAGLAQTLGAETSNYEKTPYVITLPVKLKLRGVELKLVIDGPDDERKPAPDTALIKAVVRAHDWWNRLLTGEAKVLTDIAEAEEVTSRYVRRIARLAFLAPDITGDILDGRHPADLSAERLTTLGSIPVDWADQRELLGF